MLKEILALLVVPLIVFLVFVAPIWLWLHYRQRRLLAQLRPEDRQRLQQLTEEAHRMSERIAVLEELLDTKRPEWRQF